MTPRILVKGCIYFKIGFFKNFRVQMSFFKVRILAFKVQTLSAIPLRLPF